MSNSGECQNLSFQSQEIFDDANRLKREEFSCSYYDEDTNNLLFDPCVYNQRYQRVFDILINMRWRKDIRTITEYGCGDYKLMKFFKHFLSLRKINFVDIDEIVLKEFLGNLKICDYHYSNRRFNPLKVNVFEGSIADPDKRVLDSDVVIGVEIIEHLFPDTLEAVPYVIFQSIKPKIVIFTTPNADFNVALPNLKKFRHPDHKFEWTREQFQSWSSNITLRFPDYKVLCFGVGKGPEGTENLGCCSQIALFVRRDILDHENQRLASNREKCNPKKPFGICTYMTASKKFTCSKENDLKFYKRIYKNEYQYIDDDNRSDEEKLLEMMMKNMSYQAPAANGSCFVPLHKIISTYNLGVLISEEEAERIGSKFSKNENFSPTNINQVTWKYENMEGIKVSDSSWSQYTKDKQGIVFVPNVAKQRYSIVHELLVHSKWREEISSVTEYGCADIDEYLLEQRLFFVRPLLYDHLNQRANPLEVKVFEGSISDPDRRILNSDAVVGIEIIEHLFPDTLDAMPYVIFNTIKPKIVVFTTPNADFNVALPNFQKFRHPDHKFEWTREQFQSWASNITLRFPQYEVSFFGVGRGPRGTSSLGFCSQLALFVRKDLIGNLYDTSSLPCFCEDAELKNNGDQCSNCYPLQSYGVCTYLTKSKEFRCSNENEFYRLLETAVYPHKRNDKKTKEEHILESLKYKIYNGSCQYTNEDGVDEIPLFSISRTYEGQNITEEEIKDVLLLHGYKIKDCLVKNCNGEGNDDWAPCVLYQRPETPSTDSEMDSYEDENDRLSPEGPLSDWDDETATVSKKN